MKQSELLEKVVNGYYLSKQEAVFLYENAALSELLFFANIVRRQKNPDNTVGWIIDRNVNITNVCVSGCKFCNFHCKPSQKDKAYVTTIEQYIEKIEELYKIGGRQLLLQGGLNPRLKLSFYVDLFSTLKRRFPDLKLHTLGPPEVAYIAKMEKTDYRTVLEKLIEAGLDSLPGAGAEILVDRVRKQISPGKCNADTWIEVMRQAHKLNITTSATMMYGHIETIEERIEHLVKLRTLQAEKPDYAVGFTTFIAWPFQAVGTELQKHLPDNKQNQATEYLRLNAIARLVLNNINHIQASWLTVGKEIAQIALHGGADDFGSIMIEENVVSAAGANFKFDANGIRFAIHQAGFEPRYRNQKYETDEIPKK